VLNSTNENISCTANTSGYAESEPYHAVYNTQVKTTKSMDQKHTLKMEVADFSAITVISQHTWHHIPEGKNPIITAESPKFRMIYLITSLVCCPPPCIAFP